jgi:two-component system, LytTR family, response regulator
MNILIVDDEPLARERIRELLKREADVESVREAESGASAVESIRSHPPDVVFLDIQMPEADGFQVLEKLGPDGVSRIPAIVFVTAYDQYAVRAFEFHALDYLLKPFDRERFGEALQRARTKISNRRGQDSDSRILDVLKNVGSRSEYIEWLSIKRDERIKLFKTEDIQWIEAQGNYVSIRFKETSELLRETMDNIESQLNPRTFVRIHRSAIINVNCISELQVWRRGEYRVVMRDGKALTLSRGYRHRFDEFLQKRSTQ